MTQIKFPLVGVLLALVVVHTVSAGLASFFSQNSVKSATVVSCFGPKSTGKSGLLSEIYNREGPASDSDDVNIFYDQSQKVVVIEADIDDGVPSESSLVAAGTSDVILFNVPVSALSRDGLSSLKPLLEEICDSYAKGQVSLDSPKKLVLAIRDVDSSLEKTISDKIPVMVQELWDDLSRPLKAASLKFSEMFELVVAPLPSAAADAAGFRQYAAALGGLLAEAAPAAGDAGKRVKAREERAAAGGGRPGAGAGAEGGGVDEEALAAAAELQRAVLETLDIYRELALQLGDAGDDAVNEAFGKDSEEVVVDMLGYFDDSVAESQAPAAAVARKRRALEAAMLRDLQDKHAEQCQKLRTASFKLFQQKISQLRIGPTVAEEIMKAADEAAAFYEKTAKGVDANGRVALCSAGELKALRRATTEFREERMAAAKLQGANVDASVSRKPVALTFHWMIRYPLGLKDSASGYLIDKPRYTWPSKDKFDTLFTPAGHRFLEEFGRQLPSWMNWSGRPEWDGKDPDGKLPVPREFDPKEIFPLTFHGVAPHQPEDHDFIYGMNPEDPNPNPLDWDRKVQSAAD